MKKLIYLTLSIILVFALCTCSADSYNSQDFDTDFDELLIKWELTYKNVCTKVKDAVKKPEPWNVNVHRAFIIPDETIRSMSTCGLLDTYLTFPSHPDPNGGNFYNPSITEFNSNLRENKVAIELFDRSDCFPVLAAKYLLCIKEIKPPDNKYGPYDRIWKEADDLERLLASDMCMTVSNTKEKIEFMAMALVYEEKSKANSQFWLESYNLMISIMISCNYKPFVNEVVPRIREGAGGYYLIDSDDDKWPSNCLSASHVELILKHSKEFLNEQK
jgi:hypothetical protein